MWIVIICLLLCVIFTCIGLYSLHQAKKITIQKQSEQEDYDTHIETLKNNISELQAKEFELGARLTQERAQVEKEYKERTSYLKEQLDLYKDNLSYASEQYVSCLEKSYEEVEQEHDKKIAAINLEEEKITAALDNIKNALTAGVQAQLREREKEEQLDFYKIVISDRDLADIEKLNIFKKDFNQPAIINKLIWSNYFQKKVTEMCNRILENKTTCGIYKITNLKTKQCYIGQSVNIAERWKQHCKCGCDIDASATNRLYQSMIETGIWNFTFELMEECPRELLNEKEKFWINMYQSDLYGLNSTKGNK